MTFCGSKRENKSFSMKSGWDTQIRRGDRRGRRGPASTMSAESDIRFTRRKMSRPCRGCCAAIAAFLVLLLLGAGAVYLAHLYLFRDPLDTQAFRAWFRVPDDAWLMEDAAPSSAAYRRREQDLVQRINMLFRRSELRGSFTDTEILALDSNGLEMTVHFAVYFEPIFRAVDMNDVADVLLREIRLAPESRFFSNMTIDADSFHIEESDAMLNAPNTQSSASSGVNTETTLAPPTTEALPPRRCVFLDLAMCRGLHYNFTSYPNAVGHASIEELRADTVAFRELIDAECYEAAHDFVCQLLQPACMIHGPETAVPVLPCRSYCREFYAGCGRRLPERLKKLIDCSAFPEYEGYSSCNPKPGCRASAGARSRVCDGVADCADASDERECGGVWGECARPGAVRCGMGRSCIPPHKRCDGRADCPDASDEEACLTIGPSLEHIKRYPSESTFQHRLYREGYVMFNEQGNLGKVCAGSDTYNHSGTSLSAVAVSLCHSLSFRKVDFIEITEDEESNNMYVEIEDPFASEIGFLKSACPSKQVLRVGCSSLECGKQSARKGTGVQNLSKSAQHGDWPWHAALLKEDVHVCDASLVSLEWLVTTSSCFQGQPKAEWVAKLGTVRTTSTSPWQQERRIVGMVKSPVEGSTIALIKMEEPVQTSHFVRPICLPETRTDKHLNMCNTLGWTSDKNHLTRIHLVRKSMERCENVSIATVNSVCTEALFEEDDCGEEEFAGSPMLCLDKDAKHWTLVGVSNWRIACSKIGVGRPRMYDIMTSNVDWIRKTIGPIS